MPLYFVHFHTERGVTKDPIGVEFETLADAIADARMARTEYLRDQAVPATERRHCRFEITDETGRVLANMPQAED